MPVTPARKPGDSKPRAANTAQSGSRHVDLSRARQRGSDAGLYLDDPGIARRGRAPVRALRRAEPKPGCRAFHLDTVDTVVRLAHIPGMQIGLRHFGSATIDWLIGAVSEQGCTRHGLARELCERENWRNPRGVACLAQAGKALPRLAAKLKLSLPAARPMPSIAVAVERDFPDLTLACRLLELGEVVLEPVGDAERGLWRAMMASHHPEGFSRMPGAQLRYWVRSSVHGTLGGIGFCAASWHQKARDAFLGWSPDARVANLGLVVNNDRYLLLPGIRVDNLASHVLALAAARVADDWEAAYGVRPLAAYTYVAPDRLGTCYRGAGWKCCAARTSGCPPGRRAVAPKAVWIKPLAAGWRERLCQEPHRRLGAAPTPHLPKDTDWADIEYRRGSHPDGRLRDRVVAMGRAWEHAPGCVAAGDLPRRGGTKGRLSAALERQDQDGAYSSTPSRGYGRPLPAGTGGSRAPGHNDPQLQRPPEDGGSGQSRRRRIGNLGLARPCRACGHRSPTPARSVRNQRDTARRHAGRRNAGQRAGKRALAARP